MKKRHDWGFEVEYGCHDEDCPKCGFPETLTIWKKDRFGEGIDAFVGWECSKGCGWYKKLTKKQSHVLSNC